MPLPMVHLAVAVSVQERLGWAWDGGYLLGNLAPDAIHARAGSGRPEKEVTHFHVGALPKKQAFQAIHGLLMRTPGGFQMTPSFRTGYALHLLADHLWSQGNVAAFRDRLPDSMPETEKRVLYYQETDQVDFELYRRMPWRAKAWERLERTRAQDFDDLLSAQEIQTWLARDLDWFDKIKQEPGISPVYLTYAVITDFIENAAGKAVEFFENCRQRPILF